MFSKYWQNNIVLIKSLGLIVHNAHHIPSKLSAAMSFLDLKTNNPTSKEKQLKQLASYLTGFNSPL